LRGCTALVAVLLAAASSAANAESDAPLGRMITSLAVVINSSTHKVYAVNEDSGTVSVTDERTGSTRVVKVGNGPISIAINQGTNRIYVANTGSGSISVIDGRQDAVIATVEGESHPYVLAVNEASNKVYVTNTYSDAVTVIDGATNTAKAMKVGTADAIAVDARNDTVFLGLRGPQHPGGRRQNHGRQ
jgi:YVTN family beta-propeller protein